MTIGKKIRELRLARELTLADLSKRSGVALSSLSRIETGKMTGTLESHIKISRSLGIRLPELYAELDAVGAPVEHRRATAPSGLFHSAKGTGFHLLASGTLRKKMLPMLITLPSGKSAPKEQTTVGVEKFLYLLKGKLEVEAGEERISLNVGDSVYLQASLPHTLKNAGAGPVVAVSVVSPPTL